MVDSLAYKIASVFGACKKTKFPGTIASFISLFFSIISYYFFGKIIYIFLFLFFLIIGSWAIKKIHREKGAEDYQWIGIDEWVGMWIANFFLFELNFNLKEIILLSLLSFTIFRIIDIFKFIPPLHTINNDKNQNVTAIMLDDIIAGIYTYSIMLFILGFYNLNYIYLSFLILLPPMIANMTPVLLKMKYWNTPINEGVFGKNKTWRGFLGAIITGTFFYFLLVKLNFIPFPNNLYYIIFVGFLFSFGAIGGDLLKSYFKRKINIKEGESWMPWDQIDYILGMIILTYPIYQYTFNQIILLLILGGTTSALAHRFAYLVKMINSKQ